jgi:hypothetical protein
MRARRSGVPAYLSWALGPVRSAAARAPIDAASAARPAAGMTAAGAVPMTVVPGEGRHPFPVSAAGVRHLATP